MKETNVSNSGEYRTQVEPSRNLSREIILLAEKEDLEVELREARIKVRNYFYRVFTSFGLSLAVAGVIKLLWADVSIFLLILMFIFPLFDGVILLRNWFVQRRKLQKWNKLIEEISAYSKLNGEN